MAGDIDIHLCLRYHAAMATKIPVLQSDTCCSSPVVLAGMPETSRDRFLAIFKALADGTRLDVFRLIAAQEDEICACDIVDRFDVSQPTIAHHLKVLRNAGLITVSRRGVWAYYAVDPEGVRTLGAASEALLGPLASRV